MQFVEGFASYFFVSRWTMHQLVSYAKRMATPILFEMYSSNINSELLCLIFMCDDCILPSSTNFLFNFMEDIYWFVVIARGRFMICWVGCQVIPLNLFPNVVRYCKFKDIYPLFWLPSKLFLTFFFIKHLSYIFLKIVIITILKCI